MTKPFELSAFEARQLIGQKKLSSLELVKSCIGQIEKTNTKINAIIALDESEAIRQAEEADRKTLKGEKLNLLHGIPVGIKDLNMVKNLRSTSGSLLNENHVPKDDDAIVKNIREEGGIIFCKTNTPEYGTVGNTTNKFYELQRTLLI